ncbi:hypothetical protein [Pacificibacter marinus]|uniref:hypothetical protein n=1 Tax=Pacificibacter marinus TaxID=658057 RepID=UPI001C06DA23|nr:hypothetical protein [Pacificibacter marinus]MBU2865566.1 hypothetical protein [Pacificibacter marinus]
MKVLVLGTSHSASLRMSADWIKRAYPSLEVDYFSLPGIVHSRSLMIGSTFGPTPSDAYGCKMSQQWNGSLIVDLAPYAQIFHVGERFAMGAVTRLMADYDILEHEERSLRPVMSLSAARALIGSAVYDFVEARHDVFGDDRRITFMPAPYPLARSAKRGPGFENTMSRLNKRHTAADWSQIYEHAMGTSLADFGYRFIAQPMHTRQGIFATQDIFARPKSSVADVGDKVDNRHTNANYGQEIFAAYAQSQLGLAPLEMASAPQS